MNERKKQLLKLLALECRLRVVGFNETFIQKWMNDQYNFYERIGIL